MIYESSRFLDGERSLLIDVKPKHFTSGIVFIFKFFEDFFNVDFLNYKLVFLVYIGILGPFYLFFKLKKIIQGNSLVDGYNRLFISKKPPTLPNDDFL